MARHAAARPRWARRISITASAAAIALVSGGSVWFADAASSTKTVRACYATHGGALRVLRHTPCKSTERAINWNAVGPTGPPGIAAAYIGQAHFKSPHRLPANVPELEAETPRLPAGAFVVDSMADASLKGLGNRLMGGWRQPVLFRRRRLKPPVQWRRVLADAMLVNSLAVTTITRK